jgi:hypothetical protein
MTANSGTAGDLLSAGRVANAGDLVRAGRVTTFFFACGFGGATYVPAAIFALRIALRWRLFSFGFFIFCLLRIAFTFR